MTRLSAAAAIFYLVFFASLPAAAQSEPDSASESQCFPWQELRDGRCVAKPPQSPSPAALAPATSSPATANPATFSPATSQCPDDTRNLSSQCPCPGNTHRDASGRCVTDIVVPARKADEAVVCNGGTVTNGGCACPAGFNLRPATGNASGGTCVKTNAENCLGGELTVSGTCLCNGQVVMSGETYLLEYTSGKCVPKRCPIETLLKDGKCVATSAATPAARPEPQAASKPDSPKESSRESFKEDSGDSERRHQCGRGMIHTRSGCVAARRRSPGIYGNAAASFRQYYRMYRVPGAPIAPLD
jgi:hypothetical protein